MEDVLKNLVSDKITHRKDATKQLLLLLESSDELRALDYNRNVRLAWAGLASAVTQYVALEIEAARGKKKGPDKTTTGLLRKVVQLAEDRRKLGVPHPLLRRAGKIFVHVLDTLKCGGAEYSADYVALLRFHLLPASEYCARAKASTYESLLDWFRTRLETSVEDAATLQASTSVGAGVAASANEERFRAAAALALALKQAPFDISPASAVAHMDLLGGVLFTIREDGASNELRFASDDAMTTRQRGLLAPNHDTAVCVYMSRTQVVYRRRLCAR